jgi:hypothetical protein
MPFASRDNLTIAEIVALAQLAKDAPYADCVGRLSARRFWMAEDRPRNALMFEAGPRTIVFGLSTGSLLWGRLARLVRMCAFPEPQVW